MNKRKIKFRILFPVLIGLSLSTAFIAGIVLLDNEYFATESSATSDTTVVAATFLDPETATNIITSTPKDLVGEEAWRMLYEYSENGEIHPSGLATLDAFMFSFYSINIEDLEKYKTNNKSNPTVAELESYLNSFSLEYRSENVENMIKQIVLLRIELGMSEDVTILGS